MNDGLLDTNLFIHALTRDAHSAECQQFLDHLKNGEVQAYLDPMVVHELSYSLGRVIRQMNKADVAAYLIDVLGWPGVVGEIDILLETVYRWNRTPGLAFVDAYLAVRALDGGVPIYSKNVRELVGQGVTVPDPLP